MSERKAFYSVDRLERAVAVLVGDDGVGLDVLKSTLPVTVREGVVLRVRLDTDGKPDWTHVALYLQREKHRLDSKHHQFVDDMAARTVWKREPTEKQHKYLHSLFYQLGGRIT